MSRRRKMHVNQKWFIYGLRSSPDIRIRYVGYTTSPHERRLQHLSAARCGRTTRVYNWIRKCVSAGRTIEMVIIESGDGDGWKDAERNAIASIPDLLNLSVGGSVPAIPSDARRRAGDKLKTRIFTEDHRRRISESKIGVRRPDIADRNRTWLADLHRGKKMILSDSERSRRSASGKHFGHVNGTRYWKTVSPDEMKRRRQQSSDQMKRVWAERKRKQQSV